MVSPKATYTAWGTFWVIVVGVTATPVRIDFQCRVCKQVFDGTSDPEELARLM